MLRCRPAFLAEMALAVEEHAQALSGYQREIYEYSREHKLRSHAQTNERAHEIYDLAFSELRELFGGRLRLVLTLHAPEARRTECYEKLMVLLSLRIVTQFCLDQCCGALFMTDYNEARFDHVGGPLPSLELRIAYDEPEAPDAPAARLGVVSVRGGALFRGYLEAVSLPQCDEKGWYCTGLFAERDDETGSFRLVDDFNDVTTTDDGDYLCYDKLHFLYSMKIVRSIVILRNYDSQVLHAVINPDEDALMQLAHGSGIKFQSLEDLCENQMIVERFHQEFRNIIYQKQLKKHEEVKSIFLEPKKFELIGFLDGETRQFLRIYQRDILQNYANSFHRAKSARIF